MISGNEEVHTFKPQLELAYVAIEVPEPDVLSHFFGEIVGLTRGEPALDPHTVTWRNDDKAHRIIVRRGPANDAVVVGVEAPDPATFDAVVERLRASGCAVTEASPEDLSARRVSQMVRTPAPWGVEVEIVEGLGEATTPYESPLVPGGFHTAGVGFGHAVFATTAADESHDFLVDGLGFRQSDWLQVEIAAGVELEVRFYHCNARHHSFALAKAPFDLPQKLHHLMVEANNRDDVGRAFDRAWRSDLAIPNGLGRHDNDGMFSFYVASPAGFAVEVGHGARVIHDGWDDDRRYERISSWGHQPLRGAQPAPRP